VASDRREPVYLDLAGLDRLLGLLASRGTLIGPHERDGAIMHDPIEGVEDLPEGLGDEQGPGRYRLRRVGGRTRFGYAVGPDSWKRHLHPPRAPLWSARRTAEAMTIETPEHSCPPMVLFGVRPCELAAIAVQDRVLLGGSVADPVYRARRSAVFVVVAQCTAPSDSCFCASMGTGPRSATGFDLALTELGTDEPGYVVEAASPAGAEVLAALGARDADAAERARALAATEEAASRQARSLPTDGLPEALAAARGDHERWSDVGERCLTCTNCTLVCPTCFCTTTVDVSDLGGEQAGRDRVWDSCFGLEFSHLASGPVRTSAAARYRHWITHKLSTWHDQFAESGCVGCGRCTTWCPVGIDFVAEATAARAAHLDVGVAHVDVRGVER